MRWLILAALPFLAAGCTAVPDPFLETGAIRPDAPPISTEVSPDFAAAYLPSISGRIESVRQTARDGFLEQAIVYSNATALSGENLLTVRVGTPSEGPAFLRAPTRRAILAEMRQALPGIAMTISPAMGENVHGVYGYATGPLGASGSCLYAWQFAKRVSPVKETAMGRLETGNYSAQVRLRFCHPAMPEDRIATLMAGMRLKPVTRDTFALLQYAGGTGHARSQPALVIEEKVAPAPARHRVVEEKKAEEPVVVRNAVRVPLPGEVAEKKVAIAAKPAEKAAEPVKARSESALVPLPEAVTD
ncbi:cellulose biosynthesis protein BcsN [Shinella sp. PSBB067]|uniref:cellulose biosynthesis protein BcsN n=1 Tax=Shinella sp. PSBB067 TaxID=2715959 RepID=UPI00193B9E8E|nr:cellulose biosynthesis protein BcsN [Shinella sp. PSBB067]QRI63734.1 cellulose biosynthesis protein BcsN [Shinella sp. PSBB067]